MSSLWPNFRKLIIGPSTTYVDPVALHICILKFREMAKLDYFARLSLVKLNWSLRTSDWFLILRPFHGIILSSIC